VTSWGWTVLGDPQGQGRPRFARMGDHVRAYTPKRSDSWCGRAVEVLACHWDGGPCTEGVEVTVCAVFSRPKRLERRKDPDGRIPHVGKPDADNVAKAALDAMTKAGVIKDDAQVQRLVVEKHYCARGEGPRVEIEMRLLSAVQGTLLRIADVEQRQIAF
jgi:Holliday junction resolvase RusA-like endonuclease